MPESITSTGDIKQGRVIAVLSAKGGCGATMISVNLAAAGGAGTCVVDLDFSKGDIAGFLDVWPERSLKDALADTTRLDVSLVRGLVTAHDSGMDVLPQAFDLSDLVQPRASEVERLLGLIREGWKVAVLDCGSRIDEATLTAAMRGDEVVLVAINSVPALRDARRVVLLLQRLGVPRERVRLVINRWSEHEGLSRAEIEHHLEIPVAATVALDNVACGKADYEGKLLRQVSPLSPAVADIGTLWARLQGAPADEDSTPPKRHWSLFRHRERVREDS